MFCYKIMNITKMFNTSIFKINNFVWNFHWFLTLEEISCHPFDLCNIIHKQGTDFSVLAVSSQGGRRKKSL
jgi:hypothetical protein